MVNQSNLILLVLQALRDSGPALRDLGNGINADTDTGSGSGSGSSTDKKAIFATIDATTTASGGVSMTHLAFHCNKKGAKATLEMCNL